MVFHSDPHNILRIQRSLCPLYHSFLMKRLANPNRCLVEKSNKRCFFQPPLFNKKTHQPFRPACLRITIHSRSLPFPVVLHPFEQRPLCPAFPDSSSRVPGATSVNLYTSCTVRKHPQKRKNHGMADILSRKHCLLLLPIYLIQTSKYNIRFRYKTDLRFYPFLFHGHPPHHNLGLHYKSLSQCILKVLSSRLLRNSLSFSVSILIPSRQLQQNR